MANKVYEMVTQRIIQKIEEAINNGDVLPWQKPWVYANSAQNYVTGKRYRGVNNLLLDSGEYITWSQLCDLQKNQPDLKLKQGCKKEMVVYFNFTEHDKEKTDTEGNTIVEKQKVPYLRYYNVFNIQYVEGLESKIQRETYQHNPIEQAQRIFDDYISREKISVSFVNGNKACYSPLTDSITLPEINQFPNINMYYGVLFHEAGHSTGSANRLARCIKNTFASEQYSQEELIADMISNLMLGHCGILTSVVENNSIAYMRGWLKALSDNVTMIVSASSKAQAAVDYILRES